MTLRDNILYLTMGDDEYTDKIMEEFEQRKDLHYIESTISRYMTESEQDSYDYWDDFGESDGIPMSSLASPDGEEVIENILDNKRIVNNQKIKNLFEQLQKEYENV